jgi:hypothetical protein
VAATHEHQIVDCITLLAPPRTKLTPTCPGGRAGAADVQPTCIAGFDLDADGVNELVSGWTNGKLEVRGDRQGEVIFRDNLADSVSAVLQADYRSDGREEVIACGYDGEVGATLTPAEHACALCSPRLSSPPTPLPGFTRWVYPPSPPFSFVALAGAWGVAATGDALGVLLSAGHTGDV